MTGPIDPSENGPAVGERTTLATMRGKAILRIDLVGTVLFVVVTAVASLVESDAADLANLVVSLGLLAGGCVAFAVGFLSAVGRSRTDDINMAGLFYLTASAPVVVRRAFLGLWFLQIAVAAVSVFTVQPPFGVLAPLWGIGLIPVWGARYGVFPPRPRVDGPGRRSAP